jgi:tRNA-specific 2-thiouridylase
LPEAEIADQARNDNGQGRNDNCGEVVQLRRARDRAKDQSYVLAVMTQEQLRRAHFPLGDSLKTEVRAEAAALGLRVADKAESQDICFIPDGDTAGWLADKLGPRPGPITDEAGAVVGAHQGTFGFTVGQRRGLRLGRPAADGRPRYVLRVDPESNTVVVGPKEHLRVTTIAGIDPIWTEGEPPFARGDVTIQYRAHGEELPGVLEVCPNATVKITLDQPAFGVAPGQTVVFYDADRVLGSARINADHQQTQP